MPSHTQTLSEVLHWDGRLDNRSDLLPRLSLPVESSNAAIARATYDRWGSEGLVHLIGDWSLVIRDRESTVLASDFAGVRPLYYHVQDGRVQWSNRLQSLVEETGITDLDEQYIAGFLTFGGCANRTPYKGIYSVPPGQAVCVSSNGTSIRRFWSMPTGDVIHYQNQPRYEEELRALFREAVAVRLQSKSPVLAELSGGLDSSSVVCMAQWRRQRATTRDREFHLAELARRTVHSRSRIALRHRRGTHFDASRSACHRSASKWRHPGSLSFPAQLRCDNCEPARRENNSDRTEWRSVDG
jgi:asparagine synthase (glutamine-hydrolysing)